jgi:hypothetical protein
LYGNNHYKNPAEIDVNKVLTDYTEPSATNEKT